MTTAQWNRRLLAGVGTGALAATVITGLHLGAGEAHAAPATTNSSVSVSTNTIGQWIDIARTVSNTTVDKGDVVTVTTTLTAHKTGSGLDVTIKNFQDWTPACMAYVAGTGEATANNTSQGPALQNAALLNSTTIEANPGTAWGIGTGLTPRSVTLTAQYTVNCDPGQHNSGGTNAYVNPGNGFPIKYWLDERATGTGGANPPSGLKTSGPTITVNTPATQNVPAIPISASITPDTTTNGGTVTVSGKAAADTDTIEVKVGNTTVPCTPAAVAANGDYSCTFTATNSGEVTVAGTNNAGTGATKSAGTLTVNAAATAPAAPISATITPDTTTNGGTVTVSGKAAANTDTVVVEVAGTPVTCTPATVAANGDYSCTFTATNSGEVTVAGKNGTGTGDSKSAGTLTVNTAQPGAPVVTVLPAPKVDQESTIGISAPDGNAGDDVTVTVNGHAICADLKLDANGKADCAWTPNSAGNAELKVTVNGKTTTTNLTVATTGGGNGGGGNGSSDGSSGSSEGSLGSSDGSLGDLFGGLFGSS